MLHAPGGAGSAEQDQRDKLKRLGTVIDDAVLFAAAADGGVAGMDANHGAVIIVHAGAGKEVKELVVALVIVLSDGYAGSKGDVVEHSAFVVQFFVAVRDVAQLGFAVAAADALELYDLVILGSEHGVVLLSNQSSIIASNSSCSS